MIGLDCDFLNNSLCPGFTDDGCQVCSLIVTLIHGILKSKLYVMEYSLFIPSFKTDKLLSTLNRPCCVKVSTRSMKQKCVICQNWVEF